MKKASKITRYRHDEVRKNNPDVGIVDSKNIPLAKSKKWTYDPHLDPMLVWTGKKERESFNVDTVPLHVNERIDPLTIISGAAKKTENQFQPNLFDVSFKNLPKEKELEFYQHEKNWSNRLIAGDSLIIINSLLQKEGMRGKIQMIYFDPPYGITYGSNFQPFASKKASVGGSDKAENISSEPETIKAFRDTWELKTHSYLSYLRDRIYLGRELLKDSGSMFVQISDENLHYVRMVMSEIFGEKNYCAVIPFRKKQGRTAGSTLPEQTYDFIIWYAKDKKKMKYNQLWLDREVSGQLHYCKGYEKISLNKDQKEEVKKVFSSKRRKKLSFMVTAEKIFETTPLSTVRRTPEAFFDFPYMGQSYPHPSQGWAVSFEDLKKLRRMDRLAASENRLRLKRYCSEGRDKTKLTAIWSDTPNVRKAKYVVQTSDVPIQRCMLMTTNPGDLVFDPTCGSGTTAYVAEKWGRRWITCDTSRVAVTLAKARLMTSYYKYWILASPEEGVGGGFNYEQSIEVTASVITQNKEVDNIYKKMHPKISTELENLNKSLVTTVSSFVPNCGKRKGESLDFSKGDILEEWEVPLVSPEDWPTSARKILEKYNAQREAMFDKINQSIRKNAKQHSLYDSPLSDESRLRVSGPFTMESVPTPMVTGPDGLDESEIIYRTQLREELKKNGIRVRGGQNLIIDSVKEMEGAKYAHATGIRGGGGGGGRFVASFCSKYVTLDRLHVGKAIDEIRSLRPQPDIVAFCAFSIDADVPDLCKRLEWGDTKIILVQMDSDLLTDDLKKRQSSNDSFWLVGQPDISVECEDDHWIVKLNGFDYFDPIQSKLIGGGKNRIAMWYLDTDYDGRSIMPRQVFFPNASSEDGWRKLAQVTSDIIDSEQLEKFHGTVSIPFKDGKYRRIAVKVIDDRGIESMKVINLEGNL